MARICELNPIKNKKKNKNGNKRDNGTKSTTNLEKGDIAV